jgi:pilus assembly protein CpaB
MAAKPKQVFVIGAIAILIAAIASYSLYDYLKGQETKMKEAVATENIVVASQDLPVGAVINDTQVKTVGWPKASLPQGTFTAGSQVVGRVVLNNISPGEPVTAAKLVPVGGQPGILTYKIPEGHRAMTVAVDQVSGVAGFITPGNKVDVVLSVTPPGGNRQPLSKIVLQDVPVLAIGQIISQEKKDEKPQVVPTVTMDVTPDDAEKLAVASTQGRLQLVLRRAGDTDVAKTQGATVMKVLASSGKPERVEVKHEAGPKKRIARRAKPEKKEAVKTERDEFINVTVIRGSQKPVEETFKVEK